MTLRQPLYVLAATGMLLGVAACASSGWTPVAAPLPVDMTLFAGKDTDHDGAISPRELSAGLPDLGTAGSAKLFRTLDRDGDGALSVAEYFPDPNATMNAR